MGTVDLNELCTNEVQVTVFCTEQDKQTWFKYIGGEFHYNY